MPTYEYECSACRHHFEKFQSIMHSRLRKCPKCGRHTLRRVMGTGAGILFKGSGFYQTDYRSDNYRKGAKAESDSGAKSAKSTETAAPSPAAGPDKK